MSEAFSALANIAHVWAFLAAIGVSLVGYNVVQQRADSDMMWTEYTRIRTAAAANEMMKDFVDKQMSELVDAQKAAPTKEFAIALTTTARQEFIAKWHKEVQNSDAQRTFNDQIDRPRSTWTNVFGAIIGVILFGVGVWGWFRKEHPYGI